MTFIPNNEFAKLIEVLKSGDTKFSQQASETEEYKKFITKFPAERISSLSLENYCLGKGKNDNFCWWIERGLEPVLGRYSPGTAKGHILYYMHDGSLFKNQKFEKLSESDTLQYILKIHNVIINANPNEDLSWIDDKSEIYKRANVKPIMTMGAARKIRLLSCYHPDLILPISSSEHIGHFLLLFGFPESELPIPKKSVARLMLLTHFYEKAKEQVPDLTTYGFMKALYSSEFGHAPVSRETEAEDEDSDEISSDEIIDYKEFVNGISLNSILYGPPGTGKTYQTIVEALNILDPAFLKLNSNKEHRKELKDRFDYFVKEKRIRFTTFHQSYSYEDFVEGLKAESTEDGRIIYRVVPGIFKSICDDAVTSVVSKEIKVNDNPTIWKVSIDGSGEGASKKYCLDHSEMRIGWGDTGDLKNTDEKNEYYKSLGSETQGTLNYFHDGMQIGDVVLCLHSRSEFCAVGIITSDYRYDKKISSDINDDYFHVRDVNWICRDIKLSVLPINGGTQFTLKTVYPLTRLSWGSLVEYLKETGNIKHEVEDVSGPLPYVLIIDEINRGNVSRIFGELITLIESSKRSGESEALSLQLPYSKKTFRVPNNVYLIGTMNTADRSLAGLDIALRRRFVFKEMPPLPYLLKSVTVEKVLNIADMIEKMNERIKVLLDKDHCIGHAYFMSLETHNTLSNLEFIFKNQILPLLQEYFFEDWERIAWILNDHKKAKKDQFIVQSEAKLADLFGDDVAHQIGNVGKRWELNANAFSNIQSYVEIIGVSR